MRAAYVEQERLERIRSGKVASALVVFLMPVGFSLDYFVYGPGSGRNWDYVGSFFILRLVCSLLALWLWYLHYTPFGSRHYKKLGVPIALLPAFFICCMMVQLPTHDMPYYAGLNLVILAVNVVVRWTIFESFLAVGAVVAMYTATVFYGVYFPGSHESPEKSYIFNSYYFLGLTAVIVVTGNYFMEKLRKSEFAARYHENISRGKLEEKTIELQQAIEELERTQAELVEADRVRTQARIGGFIVHNIGNALNAQINSLYALKKRSAKLDPKTRPDFESAVDRVDLGLSRIAETIQAMHMLAYPETKSVNRVQIAEMVRLAVLLTDYRWLEEGVSIQHEVGDLAVMGNRQLLVDTMVNLLLNSLDALKEKQFSNGEKPQIRITARQERDRCVLILRDNGPGINPEHQDKVFGRFTTKGEGKGTGQGLASCRHVVEAFGGTISLQTEPGRFCQFTLDFPIAAERN